MGKIAAYLVIGIGVGLGFAYWQGLGRDADDFGAPMTVDSRAPLERRLSELETSLARERYEREALATALAELKQSVTASAEAPAADEAAEQGPGRRMIAVADSGELPERFQDRIRERFPNGLPQTAEEREAAQRQLQLDRFIEAGFTADRANWIMQREEELQMEVLRARYEATQEGASPQEVANMSVTGQLRDELGDADYERYLEGLGRPTTVNVRDVLANSPAASAGLKPGDEIVAYNGQRVFEMAELSSLTNEVRPGESVALEVLRDGQPVQVYVESGPIGITGGGRPAGRRGFGGR
jgi:hypothetical protein